MADAEKALEELKDFLLGEHETIRRTHPAGIERPLPVVRVIFEVPQTEYEIPEDKLALPNGAKVTLFLEVSEEGAVEIQKAINELLEVLKRGWGKSEDPHRKKIVLKHIKMLQGLIYKHYTSIQPTTPELMEEAVPSVERITGAIKSIADNAHSIKVIGLYEKAAVGKAAKIAGWYQRDGYIYDIDYNIAYELYKDFEKLRYTHVFMIITMSNKFLPQMLQQFLQKKGWTVDVFFPKEAQALLDSKG